MSRRRVSISGVKEERGVSAKEEFAKGVPLQVTAP